jgi:hypothetical protein
MPIFVDEVVVSVEVTNRGSGETESPQDLTDNRQEIVAECVERVLEILARRRER